MGRQEAKRQQFEADDMERNARIVQELMAKGFTREEAELPF